jgi:acyl-CoA thioester hydrolase
MIHTLEKKIYYHDTDCGGVVYYANYLKYFEEARTEYLAHFGVALKTLAAQGIWFVVRRVEIDYKGPARYADTISVNTEVARVRNVSLDFQQQITRDGAVLVLAKTTLVCIDASFRPTAISEQILDLIRT